MQMTTRSATARAVLLGAAALLFSACQDNGGFLAGPECTPPPAGPAPDASPADSAAAADSLQLPRDGLATGERCPEPNR
jgi:hypothetical protein